MSAAGILAIDPGLTTGWACLTPQYGLRYGWFRLSAKDLGARAEAYQDKIALIMRAPPRFRYVVMEDGSHAWRSSAQRVLGGGMQWEIALQARANEAELLLYHPPTWKRVCGLRGAQKPTELFADWGFPDPGTGDVHDAVALILTAMVEELGMDPKDALRDLECAARRSRDAKD